MHVETSAAHVSKHGEELCGDNVQVVGNEDAKIIVLSDGLGSGVKANILSTLTTKIASGLLEKGIPIEEVVETITQTLPVCQERQLAYSTLSVLKVFNDGRCYLVEIDNPSSFLINKQGQITKLEMNERQVGDKEIKEAHFKLKEDEMIMLVSDGVVHAGIGGLLNFGLGWDGVAKHLEDYIKKYESSNKIAQKLVELCEAYYCMEPGDDTTAVVVKFRSQRKITLFTGPPKEKETDKEVVDKLVSSDSKKVICGGTTAQIVARELDRELEVELSYHDQEVPPISKMEGMDLVTEGLLTLSKCLERLKEADCQEDLPVKEDGATKLARLLLKSDQVKLLVGQAVNSAHQSLKLPQEMAIRKQIIEKLVKSLERQGKEIQINWF
ncbi:Stage II sporulation protein E (SpoIIE) [Halobacteroides halobius DSM 5150]|uniref:Stage II sporulation protein E (SpoIIE) n=1 Tax=Halobacteroides halobius (strain ATCC 35273 / DSM 5150 / MD-1) TaxID=748449 RepID=L0K6R5_HALHC|nr:SpoIIE family protein phosphatase [Halobacteroides halobius]AGB40059.1 Stage II sporulation protein E (SpoIIE) [Halobacteroides halobius DSM 5150]